MPTLDISEYQKLAKDDDSRQIQAGSEPGIRFQQVAIGGSSQQSQPFNDRTKLIRVHADVACRVAFGDNPSASSTASMRLGAGSTEYFGVTPGQRLAVISST